MKYDLTISPDYILDWGLNEALREIFQNALDQDKEGSEMTTMWMSDADGTYSLDIQNKTSKLDRSSLLLGNTTKRGDDNTIGQFGEGYKLACLVLLRLGKKVKILNYQAKEVWEPKIVYSSKFNSDLLQVDITTYRLRKVPDSDLTWRISGLTHEELKHWKDHTLVNRTNYAKFSLGPIEVITEPSLVRKIFVNGLFICDLNNDSQLKYGYNLVPNLVKLDRDRKSVSTFDLYWTLSTLWNEYGDKDEVYRMLLDGCSDVYYSRDCMYSSGIGAYVTSMFKSDFKNKVPVSNQQQIDFLKQVNPDAEFTLVKQSLWSYCKPLYESYIAEVTPVKDTSPFAILSAFYERSESTMLSETREALKKIIEQSKNWEVKNV